MGTRRRPLDWYPTPRWATEYLLTQVRLAGDILEPCSGDGAMVAPLRAAGLHVRTNDLDPCHAADTALDATLAASWRQLGMADWIVTNPPFSHALPILQHARRHARIGVAALLRLTFLEPVQARVAWLTRYHPSLIRIMPRMSFTGDGKTDSVTCAWMIWLGPNTRCNRPAITVCPREPILLPPERPAVESDLSGFLGGLYVQSRRRPSQAIGDEPV